MGDPANLDVSWRSALLFGAFMPLVWCAVLLLVRGLEQGASRFLAAFLLVFSANLVPQIIGFSGAYQVWPELTFAPFNNELWLGPLLLLHVHALLKNALPPKIGWLLIPGVVQTTYYSVIFVSFDNYRDKWDYSAAFHSPVILPLETLLTVLLTAYCAFQSWKLIVQYQQFLERERSEAADFDPAWLRVSVSLLGVLLVIWLAFELVDQITGLSYVAQYPIHLLLTILMTILGFQAISRIRDEFPKMTSAAISILAEDGPEPDESENWRQKGDALRQQMLSHQWFLEPKLTITQVAAYMATNESYLSKALNLGLQTNFNRFVNAARVAYAQNVIRQHPDAPLLDTAFAAGFSSKASFNRVFKEETGLTPSAFREQVSK